MIRIVSTAYCEVGGQEIFQVVISFNNKKYFANYECKDSWLEYKYSNSYPSPYGWKLKKKILKDFERVLE